MKTPMSWIPVYVDTWLYGSIAQEFPPEQESVWLRLLLLASKDDGYIRANKVLGYPTAAIAGLINRPVELVEATIARSVEVGKIERLENSILRVVSWEKCKLSRSSRWRAEAEDVVAIPRPPLLREEKNRAEKSIAQKQDCSTPNKIVSQPSTAVADDSPPQENPPLNAHAERQRRYRERKRDVTRDVTRDAESDAESDVYTPTFEAWWDGYPKKMAKETAFNAFRALLRKGEHAAEELTAARDAYASDCRNRGTAERFILYPASFLRDGRWLDYLPKAKPTPEEWEARQAAELAEVNKQGERK